MKGLLEEYGLVIVYVLIGIGILVYLFGGFSTKLKEHSDIHDTNHVSQVGTRNRPVITSKTGKTTGKLTANSTINPYTFVTVTDDSDEDIANRLIVYEIKTNSEGEEVKTKLSNASMIVNPTSRFYVLEYYAKNTSGFSTTFRMKFAVRGR